MFLKCRGKNGEHLWKWCHYRARFSREHVLAGRERLGRGRMSWLPTAWRLMKSGNDLRGLRSSEGCGQNLHKNKINAQGDAEEIRGRRGHVQKSYSAPPGRSELRKACRNGHFQPHPWHPDLPGKRTAPVERTASPNSEAVLAGTRTGFKTFTTGHDFFGRTQNGQKMTRKTMFFYPGKKT